MLNGTARLVFAYEDQLKEDIFKEKLSKISAKDISRSAKERHSGSLGYAETLLVFYNKNKKYPLTYEKLYTHKAPVKRKTASAPVVSITGSEYSEDTQPTIFDDVEPPKDYDVTEDAEE